MFDRFISLRPLLLNLLIALVPAAAVLLGFEMRRQFILFKREQVVRVEAMLSKQMTPALRALIATGHEQKVLENALRAASEQTAQLAGVEERFIDRYRELQANHKSANAQIELAATALSEGIGTLRTLRSSKGVSQEQLAIIDKLLEKWNERISEIHVILARN